MFRAALAELPKLVVAAVLGGDRGDVAKEALFARVLSGLALDDVTKTSAEFGRAHFYDRQRDDVVSRLRWHLARGDKVAIVSASPELYLHPVAELLGVHGLIATRLAVDGAGNLTGRYNGKNCRGEEKIARLKEWSRSSEPSVAPFIWAYGNSAGDRELLAGADVGVNTGRLGVFGRLRRFARMRDVEAAGTG